MNALSFAFEDEDSLEANFISDENELNESISNHPRFIQCLSSYNDFLDSLKSKGSHGITELTITEVMDTQIETLRTLPLDKQKSKTKIKKATQEKKINEKAVDDTNPSIREKKSKKQVPQIIQQKKVEQRKPSSVSPSISKTKVEAPMKPAREKFPVDTQVRAFVAGNGTKEYNIATAEIQDIIPEKMDRAKRVVNAPVVENVLSDRKSRKMKDIPAPLRLRLDKNSKDVAAQPKQQEMELSKIPHNPDLSKRLNDPEQGIVLKDVATDWNAIDKLDKFQFQVEETDSSHSSTPSIDLMDQSQYSSSIGKLIFSEDTNELKDKTRIAAKEPFCSTKTNEEKLYLMQYALHRAKLHRINSSTTKYLKLPLNPKERPPVIRNIQLRVRRPERPTPPIFNASSNHQIPRIQHGSRTMFELLSRARVGEASHGLFPDDLDKCGKYAKEKKQVILPRILIPDLKTDRVYVRLSD
jgi:hypothetical protein